MSKRKTSIAILTAAAAVCPPALFLLSGGCNQSHSPAAASPLDVSGPACPAGDQPSAGADAGSNRAPPADETPPSEAAAPVATSDITFDALKFDIKAGDPFNRSMIPSQTEALDGKPVRIRGYIHPQFAFMETGLTDFILTRDSNTCCFGPNRALCDFVVVHMNRGKSANYSLYPVAVEGVFTIEELVDPADPGGAVGAIYRLDADLVR